MLKTLWALIRWPYLEFRVRHMRRRLPAMETRLHHAMVTQIGYATQAWASLEIILDMANWAFVHYMPKREPFPLALGRKLDLFKRAHRIIPVLAPHTDQGLALAAEIQALSVKRHDMIHGHVLGELSDDVIRLYRHYVPTGEADRHLVFSDHRTYTRTEFSQIAGDSARLANRLVAHVEMVVIALGAEDKIHDLSRQGSIGAP